jgi:hypothetical protein
MSDVVSISLNAGTAVLLLGLSGLSVTLLVNLHERFHFFSSMAMEITNG